MQLCVHYTVVGGPQPLGDEWLDALSRGALSDGSQQNCTGEVWLRWGVCVHWFASRVDVALPKVT